MIRGDGDALDLLPGVKSVLAEMDPLIPIARSRTLSDVRDESMAREQFVLMLLSIFGVVALLLATVGVYGVTAQATRRRTQEIGIRMALGANRGDVLWLVLREGVVLTAVGLGLGLLLSVGTARLLRNLLHGVSTLDPVVFALALALLVGSSLLASYLPARRATRVVPVIALRCE